MNNPVAGPEFVDSRYAVFRLLVALLLMTIGGSAMYVVVVVLPAVQAEFGVSRADASLPYTLTMIGFGVGGMVMGRIADRVGVMVPLVFGSVCLGAGYVVAGMAANIWGFMLAQGVLVGFLGSSATFAPLIADTSLWFERRRGIAVAVCASGNYVAGAVWPPVIQHFVETAGWRQTYLWLGLFSTLSMGALGLMMRMRQPLAVLSAPDPADRAAPVDRKRPFGNRHRAGAEPRGGIAVGLGRHAAAAGFGCRCRP